MLEAPATPWLAGAQSIAVAAGFLSFGYLIADAAAGRRTLSQAFRWGLAFVAVAAYATLLMILHMVTGGGVLSSPWLTRGLTAGVAVTLAAARMVRRPSGARPDRGALAAAALSLLVGLAVWGTPVFRLLPLDPLGEVPGDIPWHMGLASELLNGESTPSATVTGEVPNFYPWLYHGLVALVARLTPGGNPFHALGPVHLLQVAGMILGLFALGHELTRRWVGGVAAALMGGLAGGFGFFAVRGLDVVLAPRLPERLFYFGDLLYRRSYNVAFGNLSPPFPRDVALALLVGALALLAAGLRRSSPVLLALGGGAIGMAGLTGGEAFFVGAGAALLVALGAGNIGRIRATAAVMGPMLGIYALWVVPLALSYLRLDGFVNITDVRPVNLTPVAILVTWGITTPLAAYGAMVWLPRAWKEPAVRVVVAVMAVAGALMGLSWLAEALGGEAFLALERRHRYWPMLHLGIALAAALGATHLLERLARRRAVAAVSAILVVGFALPSPLIASLAIPSKPAWSPLLPAALRGDPATLLNVIAPTGGERCVAAVPLALDAVVFGYTGYRLVLYRWGDYRQNLARIRWRDIYRVIPGDEERRRDNRALVTGEVDAETWDDLVRRYGVDVVVARASDADAPGLRGRPGDIVPTSGETYVVIRLGPCGDDRVGT